MSPYETYSYEGTIGFVDTSSQPGEVILHSCGFGPDNRQFVLKADNCEGQPRNRGVIGAVWPTKPTGEGLEYKEIFRCRSGEHDHFVATASNCEGTKNEGSLGWIAQSQARLITYINRDGFHTTTSRVVTSEAGVPAGTAGFLMARPGNGRQALYSCQRPQDNKPRFLTTDPSCQGFANLIGIEGWVWTSPGSPQLPRTELRQCYRQINGKIDYVLKLESQSGECTAERKLGYINDTQPGLGEFSDGTRHWVSTRAVPAQYKFQQQLGYLLQEGGAGRAALYSCINGEQEFLSRQSDCDGKRVEGIDGWVYVDRPSAGGFQLFLCSRGRDRFVWPNAGCNGSQMEEELGWDSSTPPA